MSKNSTLIIFLVATGFLIYAFNLHNDLFWDDDDWIVNNAYVHDFSHLKEIFTQNILSGFGLNSNYYRPLLLISFAVNYTIHGIKPFGYHLLSNSFHIANGILVFLLLLFAFKRKLPAFLAALLFLIHPLQTEAVTYISGRGDLLTAFFMLSALWLFLKSQLSSSQDARSKMFGSSTSKHWAWTAGSLSLLVLALLSRETAIIFPVLLMVFYIAFVSGERFLRSLKTAFIKALPYFAVVFTYGILRLTVLNFKNVLNFYDQPNIYSEHLYVRIFTFLKVLLTYFKLLFVPTGLHMERGMDPQLSFFKWPVLLSIAIIAAILFMMIRFYRLEIGNWKLKIKEQNSDFRILFFGWGWFFIALAPVSGITPINALIYEHWLYLPIVGFFFIVSYYLSKLIIYLKNSRKMIPLGVLITLLAGYFVFFGAQAIKRNVLWGKPIPFYEDILKYEPDSVRINNNLGNMYYNESDIAKAEEHYKKAVAEEDIFPQPHFNLGSILQARGDFFGAVQEYKKALEIDPGFYYAYQNLVAIYAKNGELVLAAENIEKLKQLRPNDARILYNAALIYAAMDEWKLALENAQLGLVSASSDQEVKRALEELLARLEK